VESMFSMICKATVKLMRKPGFPVEQEDARYESLFGDLVRLDSLPSVATISIMLKMFRKKDQWGNVHGKNDLPTRWRQTLIAGYLLEPGQELKAATE